MKSHHYKWSNPSHRHQSFWKCASALIGLCAAFSLTAQAQTTSAASETNLTDPAFVRGLLQRLDQLESEVKTLKASGGAAQPDAPVMREIWPKVDFSAQGDIDYAISDEKGSRNSFFLGDFDSLIVANLSPKGKILGDFAVTSDNDFGDGFSFDIERLYAEYDFSDYFNLQAGRFDTDIGWYNNTYHNGTYFQTTVDRPGIYDYEDNNGVLPVHTDGLSMNGDIPSGSVNLHYVLEVGNGRSYSTNGQIFGVSDNNDAKAVNLNLSAKPDWAHGLTVGGSFYHDSIDADAVPHTDQIILSAYAIYQTRYFEWLNEGVFMRDDTAGEGSHWTPAGYTQVSRKFGKFRPYARLEWRNSPYGDPLLANIGENFTLWGPTLGVRYDFSPMMAAKLEYEHIMQTAQKSIDQLTLQWTFRF